jgi:hypothetical protein
MLRPYTTPAIAPGDLTANLSSRDDSAHVSLVPRGDPLGLGVLPQLRHAVADGDLVLTP